MAMSRSILGVFATCILVSSVASAQAGMRPPASFGVLLGTNIATISDAGEGIGEVLGGAIDKKRRVGLNAGVFAKLPLSSMVSLQPEVHYAQNGVTFSSPGGLGSIGLKIDYVEVPVLLRFDVGPASAPFRPILMAGLSGAFRLKCSVDAETSEGSVSQDCDTDGEDDAVKKSDYSAVGGAGLALTAGGRDLSLQLRYTHGLSNLSTDDADGGKPKNRTFSILLGIGF